MGYPTDDVRATVGIPAMAYNTRWGAYFQDDWRVSRKLTLNIGVRYFLQSILNERDNSMAGVDFNTGEMVVTTVDGKLPKLALPRTLAAYGYVTSESKGWGHDLMEGDHNNFAPRFGFAYRPFDDSKTVVRGGYGVFYGLIPFLLGPYRLINGNPPFVLTETFVSSADPNNPTLTLANPFPGSGTISANPNTTSVNRHMRTPYSQQWNLTLEREIGPSIGMRLSYVGNKSSRVIQYNFEHNYPVKQVAGNLQPNRPYQPWASISSMDTNGNAVTHQMQVEVMRHFSKGLFIQSNFTWNKSLDNTSITAGYQNPYNMALDRGNADQVRNKVFYGAVTYQLPFGPGQTWLNSGGVLGKATGGWSIATITQIRSGQPFNVNFSPSQAGWYANRADVVSSQLYPAERTIKQWFNVSAFAVPQPLHLRQQRTRTSLWPRPEDLRREPAEGHRGHRAGETPVPCRGLQSAEYTKFRQPGFEHLRTVHRRDHYVHHGGRTHHPVRPEAVVLTPSRRTPGQYGRRPSAVTALGPTTKTPAAKRAHILLTTAVSIEVINETIS